MKKKIILLVLFLTAMIPFITASTSPYRDMVRQYDDNTPPPSGTPLERGMSPAKNDYQDTIQIGVDTFKVISFSSVAKIVSYTIKQMDTNSYTIPDSLVALGVILKNYVPLGFHESSTDSIKSVLTFTYAGGVYQIHGGWINQPNITGLVLWMPNAVYKTTRKLYYEIHVEY
jgi:hypothetical protein